MANNTRPWWTYPRIDNFGTLDPQGPFWKPDSNIQLPGGYPIGAILPGTVTSVQNTTFGGQVAVTIKLDSPINGLATHTFYEHMSQAAVSAGQHVTFGQLIGYNNPAGAVPLGFGFYSGDVYGSGSAWGVLQNDLAPGGQGLLNPVNMLNNAANNKNVQGYTQASGNTNAASSFLSAIPGLSQAASGITSIAGSLSGIGSFFSSLTTGWTNFTTSFSALFSWIDNPLRTVKMIIGVGVLGIALLLLVAPAYGDAFSKAAKAGKMVAKSGAI